MMDFQLNKILIFLGQNTDGQNFSSQLMHGNQSSYIKYVVYFK